MAVCESTEPVGLVSALGGQVSRPFGRPVGQPNRRLVAFVGGVSVGIAIERKLKQTGSLPPSFNGAAIARDCLPES